MEAEIDLFQIEKRIRGRVKKQMEKSQREYYLNEQIKAIQKELGDLDEAPGEAEDLARKIEEAGMPAETFHPGAGFEQHTGPKLLSLFLSFFPHVKAPVDFGPLAHPRLPLDHADPTAEIA